MIASKTKEIIENFYQFYNDSQLDKLFSLIGDDISHEVNYVKMKGKDKFMDFMIASKNYYEEKIDDYLLMISKKGHQVTTKFLVKGKYIKTDDSAIPARGQHYQLQMINYFEIANNKIIKGCCWFDESDWVKQITGNI